MDIKQYFAPGVAFAAGNWLQELIKDYMSKEVAQTAKVLKIALYCCNYYYYFFKS